MADTPDQFPDPAPKANRARWLRRALFVSVAVNLLVIGAVAGLVLTHGPRDDHIVRADRGAGFGMYVRALSAEDRAALREAYRAGRAEDGQGWRGAGRADQADLLAALRAEPFDPGAVAAVFDRHIARMSAGMARGRALMLARIEAMAAPERAAFADRLERMTDRVERHGSHPRHDGRGFWRRDGDDRR
jgi:uncharacterized membrane protein